MVSFDIKEIFNKISDNLAQTNMNKSYKGQNRRAVSEVVATLLLLSVTIVLAVMLSSYLQGSGVGNIGSSFNSNSLQSQIPPNLKITGYDTRDGTDLFGTGIGNYKNDKLCTNGCAGTANNYPSSSGGTEFIVLKIKNGGTSSYTLNDMLINDKDHLWDKTIGGTLSSSPGNFPYAGYFRVIYTGNNTQISNVIASGGEVRAVIKLSKDIVMNGGSSPPDIGYAVPIKIYFTGSTNAPTFVILSGDVT